MRGFWTFFIKEIARFFVIPIQTVFTPLVTSFLYLLIFGFAMGRRLDFDYGISYQAYLSSGIIIMYVFLQSFSNATSSIVISKYRMNIIDVMTYPISRLGMVMAYGLGGMVRGLVVGIAMWCMTLFFVPPMVHSPLLFLVSISLGGLLFSLLGTWLGFVCRTFDQISIYTNFIVTPILFLSDVFFPLSFFPEPWKSLSAFNLIVYFVRTARYGLTGLEYEHLNWFFVVAPLVVIILWLGATYQLKKGIKLR